jgi:hypothetical protein
MKTISYCILTFLLIAAFACSKNDSTVDPSSTISPTISMTGKWGVTWTGWFMNANGTITGSMSLTEKDSALSGWILLRSDTFNVAGSVSSSLRVSLSGTGGGYDYSFAGTVTSPKSTLTCQVIASHMGVIPKDTVGTASVIAYKH